MPRKKKRKVTRKAKRPKKYKKKSLSGSRKQTTMTGSKFDRKRDYSRKAKRPGYRKSKSGKVYYEARRNRSDKKGSRI